mmetsp:Transcript_4734/g.9726  ORF Transcript_4734/g.9726 Transcript_4734/m.9726 type:complete len:226 (-) Transcript_4734:560-1237(-)
MDQGEEVRVDVLIHHYLIEVEGDLQSLKAILLQKRGLEEICWEDVWRVLEETDELAEVHVNQIYLVLVTGLPPSKCLWWQLQAAAAGFHLRRRRLPALVGEGCGTKLAGEHLRYTVEAATLTLLECANHLRYRLHQGVIVVCTVFGQLILFEFDNHWLDLIRLELCILADVLPLSPLERHCLLDKNIIRGLMTYVAEIKLRARKRHQRREQAQKQNLALIAHGVV